MKIRTAMAVAMAAGLALGATAHGAGPKKIKPVKLAKARLVSGDAVTATTVGRFNFRGFVYINLATGERVVTKMQAGADEGQPFWENKDIDGNGGFFWPQDNPLGHQPITGAATGTEAMDWGDHGNPAGPGWKVDGFEFAYATDIGNDPQGNGVPGLDAVMRFYKDENGDGDLDGTLLKAITVEDLPGFDPATPPGQLTGWIVLIDTAGTQDVFTLTGSDLDNDGKMDFGYSYNFVQGQAGADKTIGPILVLPANAGGTGTSAGVEDAFDFFTTPSQQSHIGTLWFGGHTPGIPPTQQGYQPYASFFMRLFGAEGGQPTCYPDCDGSGSLNVNDYICFQTKFALGDPYADCDNSGVRNVNDYICFQTKFALGC